MNDMPIIIRRASLSDSAQLSEIYSYYVNNTAITFEDEAPTAEEFKGRMASIMSFYPYFVAEMNGVIIGYCYAGKFKDRSAYDWSVETTVYVKKGFGGKGAGRALYAALEEALKSQGIVICMPASPCPKKRTNISISAASISIKNSALNLSESLKTAAANSAGGTIWCGSAKLLPTMLKILCTPYLITAFKKIVERGGGQFLEHFSASIASVNIRTRSASAGFAISSTYWSVRWNSSFPTVATWLPCASVMV